MKLRRLLDALPRRLRRQKVLVGLYRTGLFDPVQLLEFNGEARCWVDLRDSESRACYLAQSFWPEFPPIVAAFLRSGGDFFDVGANFGLVTFGVVPLVQQLGVHFHLFEANPQIVPLLERSAAEWVGQAVTVHHCCVTDHPGVSQLTLPDDAWGHAFIGVSGESAPNLLLDSYIAEAHVERVAFLKMDVNGSELRALRGAARSLSSGVVKAAFVEVALSDLERNGGSAEELLSLMKSFGFDGYFCRMWDGSDPFARRWVRTEVNGTSLQFASASALPPGYVQDDVLFVHRTTPLAEALRSAFDGRS